MQLREAARLDPDLTDAQFNLGVAMMEKEDWPAAAEAFEHAVAQSKDDSEALARLGYAYERMGRMEDAVKQYRRAPRSIRRTKSP